MKMIVFEVRRGEAVLAMHASSAEAHGAAEAYDEDEDEYQGCEVAALGNRCEVRRLECEL